MAYELRGGRGLRARSDGFGLRDGERSTDPMANVANIADAMLVLSVGLMVALVSYWNVSLPQVQEIVQQDEVTEVDDVQEIADEATSSGSSYNELGMVYQDPSTGKLYMLTQDADKGASNAQGAKPSGKAKGSK